MNEKGIKQISKFLSLVLRHQPQAIGITLDSNGWADVSELIHKSDIQNVKFGFEILKHIVDTNDKERFSFNNDFTKIRASQGHSVNIDLGYKNSIPTDILYHGTAKQNITSIMANGLQKQNRQHVHLSHTIATALDVGSRHGSPVVLEVAALAMANNKYEFYISDNNVWLTYFVPAQYISIIKKDQSI